MREKDKTILFILLAVFCLFSAVLIFMTAAKFNWDTSLSLQAQQLIKGHVSLTPDKTLPVGDISIFNGKYYLYFGPLASIILIPFVAAFGAGFPQIALGIGSLVFSFIAIYLLSKSFKFNQIDSLWLALFFVFSTVLFSNSIINITSYLVEALGVPLILFSLVFYFRKNPKPLLIGLFIGLAMMTRITLILAIIFFILEFFKKRLTGRQLFIIFIPIIVCGLILASFNYVRFKSPFETGYNFHMGDPYPLSVNYEGYGRTNLVHIPANLYAFFIKPPQPIIETRDGYVFKFPYLKADPWGMAIWFTSPLFLMLLFNFKKDKYFASSLATTICIAIPIVTYYSVGFAQFGYRYALDFLPFLFLLLIPSLQPKLSKTAIILIITGVVFNCLYITSLWNVYPHFGIN